SRCSVQCSPVTVRRCCGRSPSRWLQWASLPRSAASRRSWAWVRRLAVRGDELLDDGRDLLAPFAAVEDAVMADVHREEIFLLRRGHPGRDIERRLRLPDARNIVALAFDREQCRVAYRLRIDAPSAVHQ